MKVRAGGRPGTGRDLPGTLTRLAARHRRLLAALLLAAAAAVAVGALAPAPPPTRPVVVAAGDLPAGRVLIATDLSVRELPPAARPAGAAPDAGTAVGHTLAAAVRAGEPITDARLLGPGLLDGTPAGQVAAPVRVADPAQVALVRPGDVVDVLAVGTAAPAAAEPAPAAVGPGDQRGADSVDAPGPAAPSTTAASTAASTQTVAAAVRVLATVVGSSDGLSELGGAVVVVAVDPTTARALAAAAAVARLSLVLRRG